VDKLKKLSAYWPELVFSLLTVLSSLATLEAYFGKESLLDFAVRGGLAFLFALAFVVVRERKLTARHQNTLRELAGQHQETLRELTAQHEGTLRDLKTTHRDTLVVIAEHGHNIADRLRNRYYDLRRRGRKKKMSLSDIKAHAAATAQDFVNDGAVVLTKLARAEVCLSVKYFMPVDYAKSGATVLSEDYYLSTLSRSSNSDKNRVLGTKARVGDNTDYVMLVRDCYPHFWAPNLEDYDRDLKKIGACYRNSTPKWEDYYAATVNVPIRLKMKSFLNDADGDGVDQGYHMLGLLCADSISTEAFTEALKPVFLNLLKCYADAFYNYLDLVYLLLGESSANVPIPDANDSGNVTIRPLFQTTVTIGTTNFSDFEEKRMTISHSTDS
jgi:hypothetical protein